MRQEQTNSYFAVVPTATCRIRGSYEAANLVGISVLIELTFLHGRAKLAPHPVSAILSY